MPRGKQPRPGYVRTDTPHRVRGYSVAPEDGDRPALTIEVDEGAVCFELSADEMREMGQRMIDEAGNDH